MAEEKRYHRAPFRCMRGTNILRGSIVRPAATGPLAILCHGFMGSRKETLPYAQKLAEMGYCALCFDFAGGTRQGTSTGDTRDMTIFTEVEDLLAVIEAASTLPSVDASRITLLGCSQGGLVCALAAARLGARVENLVLVYPALCIPDDARRGNMIGYTFDPADIPETLSAGPGSLPLGRGYPAAVLDMDVFQAIRGYKGKVLILHGEQDPVVHPDYSRRAAEVYREEGADCQMTPLATAGHGFLNKHLNFAREMIGFFLQGYRAQLRVDVAIEAQRDYRRINGTKDRLIPFSGQVSSPEFSGVIQPGAMDTQVLVGRRLASGCAVYTALGERGALNIRNQYDGQVWRPTLDPEDPALAHWRDWDWVAGLDSRPGGPVVWLCARSC